MQPDLQLTQTVVDSPFENNELLFWGGGQDVADLALDDVLTGQGLEVE
ncbi:hypothetical protein IQ265_24860 [Nodosilinea sp. LEGE 06152]|nr:hypothetical protein [Nodosilinea sp. LEGE 06152]MBE9160029.1 hypothetical protein [Nodosilinea sp. LEGE 06152]